MSFSAGVAAGIAIGKKKWGGGGGGEDEWSPPEDWLDVPEPNDYDIYVLILITEQIKSFGVQVLNAVSVSNIGELSCDWGDGNTETVNDTSKIMHTYEQTGQYLVHFTGNEDKCFWRVIYPLYSRAPQIIKSGSKIMITAEESFDMDLYWYLFSNSKYLKYVEIKHQNGLPVTKTFMGCVSLEKLVYYQKLKKIGKNMFNNCAVDNLDLSEVDQIGDSAFATCQKLSKINAPECVSVGNFSFSGCSSLISVNLPNCTAISDRAFENCYNLQKIVVAENCTFGSNCFSGCYSLYPRPDGSTN